jgi:hypothetical protein
MDTLRRNSDHTKAKGQANQRQFTSLCLTFVRVSTQIAIQIKTPNFPPESMHAAFLSTKNHLTNRLWHPLLNDDVLKRFGRDCRRRAFVMSCEDSSAHR